MPRRLAVLVGSVVAASLLLSDARAQTAFEPVTDEMLQNPAPGDWLMWRRTLNGWGYSPLDQVNKETVAELQMVWTRGLRPGAQ